MRLFVLVVLSTLLMWVGADATASVGADGGQMIHPDSCSVEVKSRTAPSAELLARLLRAPACRHNESTRTLDGPSLAYVTPWNGQGYDWAKEHWRKLTHISPVWLQVRMSASTNKAEITGTHDIDAGWLFDLHTGCQFASASTCPKIVPRVAWEAQISAETAEQVFDDTIVALSSLAKVHKFDGYVIEVTSHPIFTTFIKRLADELHGSGKILVYVAPPKVLPDAQAAKMPGALSFGMLRELFSHVDLFSLMTYDYSSSRGQAGANSPLSWVKSTVSSFVSVMDRPSRPAMLKKLLIGIPFYAYDNTDALVGKAVLDLLERVSPRVKYDRDSEEHFFTYTIRNERHTVYFASPYSVQKRVELANQLGVGAAIWEVGQGYTVFGDVL